MYEYPVCSASAAIGDGFMHFIFPLLFFFDLRFLTHSCVILACYIIYYITMITNNIGSIYCHAQALFFNGVSLPPTMHFFQLLKVYHHRHRTMICSPPFTNSPSSSVFLHMDYTTFIFCRHLFTFRVWDAIKRHRAYAGMRKLAADTMQILSPLSLFKDRHQAPLFYCS